MQSCRLEQQISQPLSTVQTITGRLQACPAPVLRELAAEFLHSVRYDLPACPASDCKLCIMRILPRHCLRVTAPQAQFSGLLPDTRQIDSHTNLFTAEDLTEIHM